MTRCLDEATLQCYFDGELSIELMESATSHLASCVTCAAAARELEEESALLTTALAAEFEASVPTERLRQRIDAAVLGERVASAQSTEKRSGLAAFFAGLLSFGTQRTLGYASLAVVLAFGAVAGLVMMKDTPENPEVTAENKAPQPAPQPEASAVAAYTPWVDKKPEVQSAETPVLNRPVRNIRQNKATLVNYTPAPTPVKLLPGERAYLQTIARLDSTIQSNAKDMKPSLRAEYERNLAVVDRAIAATRTAAKSNPNDPDAADFMFAAYQSKVDLLNTIADVRAGGPRD
ncbi:MAG TPA: hypothetical protein VFR78_16235 [Pyrinomonadaceae bacterium]|nr:hypothetical protein [Pyrinomonadaceae bacterium]